MLHGLNVYNNNNYSNRCICQVLGEQNHQNNNKFAALVANRQYFVRLILVSDPIDLCDLTFLRIRRYDRAGNRLLIRLKMFCFDEYVTANSYSKQNIFKPADHG